MHESLDVLQAALNVLTALSQKGNPSPGDVQVLTGYAGPQPPGMDLDEFACVVIQNVIGKRAAARRRSEM